MKIVFMASSSFAIPSLRLLLKSSQYHLAAIYTKVPKPAHRGHKLTKTDVHVFADENNIPSYTATSLKSEIERDNISRIKPDIVVVVSYGLILPQEILSIPKNGCINIHPSLLPKFRGPSPIQYAILAGLKETGVSIIKMIDELDAGDILLQRKIFIEQDDNYFTLHNKMSELSSKMLKITLDNIDNIKPIKQDDKNASYSQKITDYKINWKDDSEIICRKIRALYPKCFFLFKNKRIKILQASHYKLSSSNNLPPGSIINYSMHIQCKDESVLVPKILQIEGKNPCIVEDFQRGYRLNELTILT